MKLFSPVHIGKMQIQNRLVMAPIATNDAREDGSITQDKIDYYVERAKGGVGLIIVEATHVNTDRKMVPKGLGIDQDHHFPGLKNLVRHLKSFDVKVAIQLGENLRWQNLKPSDLSVQETRQIIERFVRATVRAKEVGFDAVEYHMCHSYTLSDFLSKARNDREDDFGKGFDGRMKVATQIVEMTKQKVGKDYPLICRINGDEFMVKGNTLKDSQMIAKRFEEMGVHAIDVSCGRFDEVEVKPGKESTVDEMRYSTSRITLTQEWPDAGNIYLAEGIKEVVNIPVIGGGKVTRPEIAEKVIRENRADMVYLGRPLLRDPYFPIKAKEERWDEIKECDACNYCTNTLVQNREVHCKYQRT